MTAIAPVTSIAESLTQLDWERLATDLDAHGCAIVNAILPQELCEAIAQSYANDELFRKRIVMARHGFGRGEYKYFRYPLPEQIAELRASLYPALSVIANRWNETMRTVAMTRRATSAAMKFVSPRRVSWRQCFEDDVRYPATHAEFLERCHKAGQTQPTPLLLQYGPGDYNCLHQDLYGEHIFPLQVAFLLSDPQRDFSGGEFVLTEQRPRMQSRAEVVPLKQGDGVVFPVHHRPVQGTKGFYRVNLRHGVSRVRSGRRHTLGIIFHDAQ